MPCLTTEDFGSLWVNRLSSCRRKKSSTLRRAVWSKLRGWRSWSTTRRKRSRSSSRRKCESWPDITGHIKSSLPQFGLFKHKEIAVLILFSPTVTPLWPASNSLQDFRMNKHIPLRNLNRPNVCFICLHNSQMSNLMNQARLKVLKARDDMISVSRCTSSCRHTAIFNARKRDCAFYGLPSK